VSEFAPSETPVPSPQPPARRGPRLPAEYYSLPAADIQPIFPRGLRLGCGVASAVFIVALFAAGGWLSGNGAAKFLAWTLQMVQIDLGGMYDKDVSKAQKEQLDAALADLQKNVDAGKVPIARIQAVLTAMRTAVKDRKLSPAEVEQITKAAREANQKTSP